MCHGRKTREMGGRVVFRKYYCISKSRIKGVIDENSYRVRKRLKDLNIHYMKMPCIMFPKEITNK